MTDLIAGLDEIGTETQMSDGWTFVVLSVEGLARFKKELSPKPKQTFHGKKFKTALEPEYRHFLTALRREAEGPDSALLAFSLLDRPFRREFVPSIRRLVAKSLGESGLAASGFSAVIEHVFPGLATLQRLTRDMGSAHELAIELDRDDVTRRFASMQTAVGLKTLTLQRVTHAAYEGYRKHLFSNSPALGTGSISVVNDAKSLPVQAADVLGNFAMAYALVALGHPSKKLSLKAVIFSDVFGDLLKGTDLPSQAYLRGNDMELKQSGALTLLLSNQ